MAHPPDHVGAVEQHGRFGVAHHRPLREFAQPVAAVLLVQPGAAAAALEQFGHRLDRIAPVLAQVAPEQPRAPAPLVPRVRNEADADLVHGERERVVGLRGAVAAGDAPVEEQIGVDGRDVLDREFVVVARFGRRALREADPREDQLADAAFLDALECDRPLHFRFDARVLAHQIDPLAPVPEVDGGAETLAELLLKRIQTGRGRSGERKRRIEGAGAEVGHDCVLREVFRVFARSSTGFFKRR